MAGQYRQVGDAIAQLVVSVDQSGNPSSGTTETLYTQIMNADDLFTTYFYEGVDTADQRVVKVRFISTTLGKRVDENFAYTLTGTGYLLVSKTRVVEDIPS
jgi:hypothetical protein